MVFTCQRVVMAVDAENYLPFGTYPWGDDAWQPIYGRFLFTQYSVTWTLKPNA